MHFRNAFIAASTVISVVSAITFNVAVGQNDQNVFDPPLYVFFSISPDFTYFNASPFFSLTGIQNGDTIDFQLYVLKA